LDNRTRGHIVKIKKMMQKMQNRLKKTLIVSSTDGTLRPEARIKLFNDEPSKILGTKTATRVDLFMD